MAAHIYTIGHSDRDLADFIGLLNEHDIKHVVDVRKLTGSNRFPQFNADALEASLAAQGIGMHHEQALAGRRRVSKTIDFEVNAWWTNRSFHNYADHALSPEFAEALEQVRELAAHRPLALMCAEAVWWRCHRRIIADHLLARGEQVLHVIDHQPAKPAELSPGAVVSADPQVTYPRP